MHIHKNPFTVEQNHHKKVPQSLTFIALWDLFLFDLQGVAQSYSKSFKYLFKRNAQ